jgi:hypothetical protein
MKLLRLAHFASMASLILLSCASSGESTKFVQTLGGSRLKTYDSIAQLRADSVAVALIRATSTRRLELVAGTPFTVTTVNVLRVLAGENVGSTLKLRQLGRDGIRLEGGVMPVRAGSEYVVFLQHFTFGPGGETDQFLVTGEPAGILAFAANRVTRLDEDSVAIPASLTLAELTTQLN